VKIRYDNTVDDLVLFNRYHWDHTPRMRRTRAVLIWALPLTVLLPAAAAAWWVEVPLEMVLAAVVVLLVLYLLVAPGAFNRSLERQVRRMYRGRTHAAALGEHELELTDSTLIERTPLGESAVELRTIARLVSTEQYTLIYVSDVQAHVIPRHGIREGEYDEFVAAVAQRLMLVRPS
jgi:hypothetical protein